MAVLIFRPAIVCCVAGVAVKLELTAPILKEGGCVKWNPPPGAEGGCAMEGVAVGAGGAPDPAPNAKTPVLPLGAPNALAPPNWKPPLTAVELVVAPKTGVAFACCPNTGAALGLAPKAADWDTAAVKGEGAGDPKAGALDWVETWPKEGAWPVPNPEVGAELKTNGDGAADGAAEDAVEGAAAPNVKVEAVGAAVATFPKRKG